MLRPPGSPPLPTAYRARIEGSRPALAQRARAEYGLEINPGPLEINSRPALIGEKYAETRDLGKTYHDAVMRAYWQEARPINELPVLQEIASSVGLDTDQFALALDQPEYEAAVEADIRLAREYQLEGVPSLIFAEKYLVVGAQPYDFLQQVVERVLSEEKSSA